VKPRVVRAGPGDEARADLLAWVHRTLVADPALSPRSLPALSRAYDQGRFWLIQSDGETVGWVIRIAHRPGVQELAGAFIRPDHRRNGAARVVLDRVLAMEPITVCTTSSGWLADYLQEAWGFQRCGLFTLLRLTRGRFAADRLDLSRLRYGRSYVRGTRIRMLYCDSRQPMRICPVCGRDARHSTFLASDTAFGTNLAAEYAVCRRCRHTWQPDSRPEPTMFDETQSPFVRRVMEHPLVSHAVYAPRLRWLSGRVPIGAQTRILDVGCGTGAFLRLAHARYGADCHGVDADAALAGPVRDDGVVLRTADFMTYRPAGRFDLITMFQVLEHFSDPRAALDRAMDLLAPGGHLCIETPTGDALARRLFGRYWFPLLPPFHRQIYSDLSLRTALAEADPDGRLHAWTRVYLPGEYVVSANLPFTSFTPHPHQRRRLSRGGRLFGGLVALLVSIAAAPLELLSLCAHRWSRTAGHVRVLYQKGAR
jgi:2-polyprenyl-3-methyl-5-hydroxy-6-metoxy-1,4-benzoquinol methylase